MISSNPLSFVAVYLLIVHSKLVKVVMGIGALTVWMVFYTPLFHTDPKSFGSVINKQSIKVLPEIWKYF